jgi:hypothetical protein
MARFNEILVGRFNRALQKTFGMKGGPPSAQLATEIQPNISMFWGNEQRYLEGWQKFGVQANVAAGGAGTRASVRIDNPKGSNICAVLEKITFAGQAAAADGPLINYSILSSGDQALSVIATNTGLDQRGPQTPQLHVTANNIVQSLIGVTIWGGAMVANTSLDAILDEAHTLPLLPNSSYTFYSSVLNQALSMSLWWRERPLEASEIT